MSGISIISQPVAKKIVSSLFIGQSKHGKRTSMDENRDKKYGITTRKCDTTWKLSQCDDIRKDMMEYDETLLNIILNAIMHGGTR